VLTFAYLIKFLAIEENIFHALTDEAKVLSAEAGKNPLAPPLFELQLKDRIYDENRNGITAVEVDQLRYLYQTYGMSDVISLDLNYIVNIKLPIPFHRTLPVCESLIFRGFVGKNEDAEPMPFEEMEKEKPSDLVWIFPRAGGKYHGENCTYIKSEPKQMTMNSQIRNRYSPCSLCHSAGLPDGNLAYCFRTGESYHTGNCPIVDKYVISIERDEAIKRGYTPCLKCGGN
jgi:hypothetical protein